MKTNPRRFAPIGLVLAVLAVLSFVLILIVKGLASGGIVTLPDAKIVDQALLISVGVFVLGLALTAFLDPDKTRTFLVGRQVQYGSNAIIMLLAFLGILFFINLLVYQYSSTSTPWDWTADKQNTLAPETLNILKALPEPVTVRAYYVADSPTEDVQKLLDSYKQNSGGKLTYQFIDPNYDPEGATADGVTRNATLVMVMAGRKETVNFPTEEELDATLIKLTNPTQNVIYFLTGHGERDTEITGDSSLTQIKALLEKKNYIVKVLNLSNQRNVPEDAKTIVIAGPQVPLIPDEVTLLEAYLGKGGALIVMQDPIPYTKFGSTPDPLAEMITKWGITLRNDVIIDTNARNALNAVVESYNRNHPITYKLLGYTLLFNTARSLVVADPAPDGISLMALAQTSAGGGVAGVWGETDFKSIGTQGVQPSFELNVDSSAPLTLFASAENMATKGRLVVFGDSDFATNILQQNYGDALINAIDWSTQQENLISLTPKNNVERTFQPPQTAVTIGILLLSLCFIPLMVVFAGVWAWYSRRRRG